MRYDAKNKIEKEGDERGGKGSMTRPQHRSQRQALPRAAEKQKHCHLTLAFENLPEFQRTPNPESNCIDWLL